MKNHIRVLGIDDSPFTFDEKEVSVVGVVTRLPSYIEGILHFKVTVDGNDATLKLIETLNASRFKPQIRAVLMDGIALGGFNVVDIQKVFESTGVPVVTITRDEPDLSSMKKALREHVTEWESRYELIEKTRVHKVSTSHKDIHVACVGLNDREANTIISKSTVRGCIPEAIRVAHLVASGMKTGESRGKA